MLATSRWRALLRRAQRRALWLAKWRLALLAALVVQLKPCKLLLLLRKAERRAVGPVGCWRLPLRSVVPKQAQQAAVLLLVVAVVPKQAHQAAVLLLVVAVVPKQAQQAAVLLLVVAVVRLRPLLRHGLRAVWRPKSALLLAVGRAGEWGACSMLFKAA
jgi:hypothetical protein